MSATTEAHDAGSVPTRTLWIARVGSLLIRALAATWRIRIVNRGPVDVLRAEKRPVAFAFWHGEMLPLLWQHRDEGVAILISSHRDGEIIAQIGHRLGFRSIRGSTSRGAGRALLALVRELQAGHEVAVTPDGPRGPARRFAPGTLIAAQRAGAWIIPVTARASRAWRLRSWDAFLVPKPFARVTIAYGAPERVASETARDAAQEAQRFEAILDAVGASADG